MALAVFLKHPPIHEPSRAQKDAGNYPKRKIPWHGRIIRVENEIGSMRRWRDQDSREGQQRITAPYGYLVGTRGVDGDEYDCFVGPNLDAPTVFIVHTRRPPGFESYDEDKSMIGWLDAESAQAAFLDNYSDPRFLGDMVEMPVDEFLAKLDSTKDDPQMIKAEQFDLFDQPVHVSGSVKHDGTIIKPYTRVQLVSASKPTPTSGRAYLKWFEDRYSGASFEWWTAIAGEHGKPLFGEKGIMGSQSRATMTPEQYGKIRATRDCIFTHLHPSGCSFSKGDWRFAIYMNLKEMRAYTHKYVHIIRRGPNGWGSMSSTLRDFQKAYKKIRGQHLQGQEIWHLVSQYVADHSEGHATYERIPRT